MTKSVGIYVREKNISFWDEVFSEHATVLAPYLENEFVDIITPSESVKNHIEALQKNIIDKETESAWNMTSFEFMRTRDEDLKASLSENSIAKQAIYKDVQRIASIIVDIYESEIPVMYESLDHFTNWGNRFLDRIHNAPKILVGA